VVTRTLKYFSLDLILNFIFRAILSWLFLVAKFCQKAKYKKIKNKRRSDFGGFQLPEVRKEIIKIVRFLYLVFIV
jgi:hypothetical protein